METEALGSSRGSINLPLLDSERVAFWGHPTWGWISGKNAACGPCLLRDQCPNLGTPVWPSSLPFFSGVKQMMKGPSEQQSGGGTGAQETQAVDHGHVPNPLRLGAVFTSLPPRPALAFPSAHSSAFRKSTLSPPPCSRARWGTMWALLGWASQATVAAVSRTASEDIPWASTVPSGAAGREGPPVGHN